MKFKIEDQDPGVKTLYKFLKNQKLKNPSYRVLDVGGAMAPFFWEFTDTILDWNDPASSNTWIDYKKLGIKEVDFKGKFLQGDITNDSGWNELLEEVKVNGKYDFSICRHTIEDIDNPQLVVQKLPEVSKNGFIAVPSKYWEMEKGIYPAMPQTRGLHHHRWIFITKNRRLYGLPKMGWTDSISDKDLKKMKNKLFQKRINLELNMYWENSIDVIFLSSSIHSVPENYGDEFVRKFIDNEQYPWSAWINLLINSD